MISSIFVYLCGRKLADRNSYDRGQVKTYEEMRSLKSKCVITTSNSCSFRAVGISWKKQLRHFFNYKETTRKLLIETMTKGVQASRYRQLLNEMAI